MTANDYWKQEWGEEPQTDSDKLAVAMMDEYGKQQYNQAINDAVNLYIDTDVEEEYYPWKLEKLKKK